MSIYYLKKVLSLCYLFLPYRIQINRVSIFNKIMTGARPGDKIVLIVFINNVMTDIEIILTNKTEKGFKITPTQNPGTLQKQILEGWLKG